MGYGKTGKRAGMSIKTADRAERGKWKASAHPDYAEAPAASSRLRGVIGARRGNVSRY